uniref:Mitotic checkpoint regulator, MAD2B-interacting, putative n=1 Tax=Theileria annulata TaxID=5874 RepID=A0A3B0MNQ1_THEAN
MDWLNSALSDSDSDDSDHSANNNLNDHNINTSSVDNSDNTHDNVNNNTISDNNSNKISNINDDNKNDNSKVEEKDIICENKVEPAEAGKKDKSGGLFTINRKLRRIEKFDNVKIKSQELTESDLLESQPSNSDDKLNNLPDSKPPEINNEKEIYEEGIDYNEAMTSFNKSNVNFDKLLKSSQWLGPKVKVTDIKADDLLLSKLDKERNYTCNKEILYEGVKRFNMPTRLMETEDGQVITTNVARRTQKRKHQINWLAMEAQDKEAEIMEQTIHMRKSKRETQMKYGW